MNARFSLSALFVLWQFLTSTLSPAQETVLRAGVAKVDITPAQPCILSGYASRTNLSTGVHDPLSARAIAFEQGGKRLVLVSADIIGFYAGTADHMRRAICEACKLEPSELMLAGTHTHAAPTLTLDPAKVHPNNFAYTQALCGKLVKVVQEALARLRPVTIGVGVGASPVGVNRRQAVTDSAGRTQIRLGRNPDGSTDHEVQVLQIRERDGDRLAAVMFAYATHSTSLGGKNLVVSGDVHGLAEQFVEKHLGNGVIAPAFAGASGDIDPWFRVLPEFKTANGWIPEPVLLGTMLGEEVVTTAAAIRQSATNGPIHSIIKTVELPTKPDYKPTDYNRTVMTLTAARVGDVAFVGLSGEIFHQIGRSIKTASPFPHTFIMTHCNGGSGSLVVKEAYAEGGYEVKTTPFAPEAAEIVVKEVAGLLKQLKEK
ncbi:MAG: neutral/alkaline non-lysosomal ceramidase N-terminal domain-containing protein [Verrucomicrobiae bacterium]|nr:neutral/alkaline non-lysosomal ceramidase N-terminal domain-containing protein [Verrucomicrobiae bacterium]